MSNYSRFSGFNEAEALPPNTFICVIQSERPAVGGISVKGKRGVAYRVKDDPESVYVIGEGFYWRGPRKEVTAFEYKPDPMTDPKGGYLLSESIERVMQDIMKQAGIAASAYYTYPGGTISNATFKIVDNGNLNFDVAYVYNTDGSIGVVPKSYDLSFPPSNKKGKKP